MIISIIPSNPQYTLDLDKGPNGSRDYIVILSKIENND